MTARARWHFGGGAGYCEGCRRQGLPCARGESGRVPVSAGDGASHQGDAEGRYGEVCAYFANEPLTEAGWQAWDILTRCAGQLRMLPGAVVGLDLGVALAMGAAAGYDAAALAELLPAGEAGLVGAMNERLRDGRE